MKQFVIIIAIALSLSAGACGVANSADEPVSAPEPVSEPASAPVSEPVFTGSEQEVIDYCNRHVNDMEDLVVGLEDIINGEVTSVSQVLDDLDPVASGYARIRDTYNATNDGEVAGGEVAYLETLWEQCGNNVRSVCREILKATEGKSMNSDRAATALYNAGEGVDEIRSELDKLAQY